MCALFTASRSPAEHHQGDQSRGNKYQQRDSYTWAGPYSSLYANDLRLNLKVYMLTIDPMTGDRQASLSELAFTLGLLPPIGVEILESRLRNFTLIQNDESRIGWNISIPPCSNNLSRCVRLKLSGVGRLKDTLCLLG